MVEVDESRVAALARAVTGSASPVASWDLVPTGIGVHNMTTCRIDRLRGTLSDGTDWSLFAKTLHPASSSPMWSSVPEAFHEQVLAELNWLDEPRVYRSGLADALPPGIRMPVIHAIDEVPGHMTLWMEDVPDRPTWDVDRYQRSARALGRLAGRWPGDSAARSLGLHPHPIDGLFFGKICNHDLKVMDSDEFWAAPEIAAVVDGDHRSDLYRLAGETPALLERLRRLPLGLAHGDAAPANLHDPGDATVVAIDWSYASVAPVGSDLGQLAAGCVAEEDRSCADVHDLVEVLVDAFLVGLADEGATGDRSEVRRACITHLVVHFVFSALVLDESTDPITADAHEVLRHRATLARAGMDLARSLG